MAKLIEIKDTDEKQDNIKKSVVSVLCLCIVLLAAVISFNVQKTAVEDATESLVCVHVKGAVVNSGVYYVPYGTRIYDLSEYVGGFLDNADVDGVNLAKFVTDGQEVYIPYKGSPEKGAINLNTATDEELQLVSGIGDTYARKIIEYRESHGGFKSVTELKQVLGVTVYEAVREKFYIAE